MGRLCSTARRRQHGEFLGKEAQGSEKRTLLWSPYATRSRAGFGAENANRGGGKPVTTVQHFRHVFALALLSTTVLVLCYGRRLALRAL